MARLVASLGTSAGVVYETLLNLCRGSYDGWYTPRLCIDEVVLVRTNAPAVEQASKVLKLLLACSDLLPKDRRLPEYCRSPRVVDIVVDVADIDSRAAFEEYAGRVTRVVGKGDVVDITGGRASMAVALARAALASPATMVVTTIIPQDKYRATTTAQSTLLKNYNVDQILNVLREKPCSELAREMPDLARILSEIVTGKAKTIQLYP